MASPPDIVLPKVSKKHQNLFFWPIKRQTGNPGRCTTTVYSVQCVHGTTETTTERVVIKSHTAQPGTNENKSTSYTEFHPLRQLN